MLRTKRADYPDKARARDGTGGYVVMRRRDKSVGREGREGFSIRGRRVILTVGHTLILDLQVLVGPWAGVREDV